VGCMTVGALLLLLAALVGGAYLLFARGRTKV
jgi:hypothetical protein